MGEGSRYRTGGDYIDSSPQGASIISASIEKVKADGKKKTLGRKTSN